MVSGIMEFTDKNALNTILARLDQALEVHSDNFADQYGYMSDDAFNNYAASVGFDEFLPMKEFEAYFGFYSLRQKIETEEIAWLATTDPWSASVYPDDNYAIEDDAERTVNNQYGQVRVSGEIIEPISLTEGPTYEYGCTPESFACEEKARQEDTVPLPNDRMVHWKLIKKKGSGMQTNEIVFHS